MKLPKLGTEFEGGYFGGQVVVADKVFAVVWAPRAQGLHAAAPWHPDRLDIAGTNSISDSMANTVALADAGSDLARWALDLDIHGYRDWCLPARDVLELAYRNFKPGTVDTEANGRDGENPSSLPCTGPYATAGRPLQTTVKSFRQGGAESFESDQGGMSFHWSSTQAGVSWAWMQNFWAGGQQPMDKGAGEICVARAVRLERVGRLQILFDRPTANGREGSAVVAPGPSSTRAAEPAEVDIAGLLAELVASGNEGDRSPFAFNAPAPIEALAAAESALGFQLPAELHALYLVHDGQGPEGPAMFRPWFRWNTLQQMIDQWRSLQQLTAEIEESDATASSAIPRLWLPVGRSETEQALYVDASGSSARQAAALFSWDLAEEPERLAASLSAYLIDQTTALRRGELRWSGDEWIAADHSLPRA